MLLKKSMPIKRNSLCPCKSGKKLKHCCIDSVKGFSAAINAGVDRDTIMARHMSGEPLIKEG